MLFYTYLNFSHFFLNYHFQQLLQICIIIMNYLKLQDLSHLEQDSEIYQNNFQSDYGVIARNALNVHCFKYLVHVKTLLGQNTHKPLPITFQDLKQIRKNDAAEFISQKMAKHYIQIVSNKEQGEILEDKDLIKISYLTFKEQIIQAFVYCSLDVIFRLAFSVFTFSLFQAVANGNTSLAYILTALLTIFLYLSQVCKYYAYKLTNSIIFQLKSSLIMLLYIKTSKLTSYVIRSEDIGKITNLLASDFGVLEQRGFYILYTATYPLTFIGNVTVLILRIGWPALIGTIIMIITVIFVAQYSRNTGDLVKESNIFKDKRIESTSQTIQGIKFIKYYGWQLAFKNIIQGLRQSQINLLKRIAFRRANQKSVAANIGQIATFIILFFSYTIFHKLTLAQTFSALQVVSVLKIAAFTAVIGIGTLFEVKVVFGRFANVFNIKNKQMIQIDPFTKKPLSLVLHQKSNTHDLNGLTQIEKSQYLMKKGIKQGQIVLQSFQGYWKDDLESPSLKNINLNFRSGYYYGITGKTGSGKSGLLGAIIGQIPYYSGKLQVSGKVAYVQQQPIIFSDTLRVNILFGQEFNEQKYENAIQKACLKPDLQMLAEGDMTIIGQRGITLSGGQKVRLSLARALYSDSDIYLLDDPLSSVDSKVAKELNYKCFKKLSKSKTVILVTHQIAFLYDCDQIIVMENGAVVVKGPPKIPDLLKIKLDQLTQFFSKNQERANSQNFLKNEAQPRQNFQTEQQDQVGNQIYAYKEQENLNLNNRFTEKEEQVNGRTYFDFIFANPTNNFLFPLVICFFLGNQVLAIIYYKFLTQFQNIKAGTSATFGANFTMFWAIQILVTLGMIVFSSLKIFGLNASILNSTTTIHQKMVMSVVRSPSHLFDSTPSGVLINKFSNDLGVIDSNLIHPTIDALAGISKLIFCIVVTCALNPKLLFPTIGVYSFLFWFFYYSRPAIIAAKQLDLQSRAPIFHFFNESFNGITQIRIYKQQNNFTKGLSQILNKSVKSQYAFELIAQGLGFYVTLGTLLFLAFGMIIGISSTPIEQNGNFCIVILYLIRNAQFFKWYLRQIITTQSLMVNAARINHLTQFQSEAPLRTQYDKQIGLKIEVQAESIGKQQHKKWPENQCLQIHNLSARYRSDLPCVLHNISLNVGKGQKIGIVGRTGAGKSSIIQALFRMFQPQAGTLYNIGGFDALKMGLHSLRQHISIIPQTPFLFKATIRQNIDPFMHSEEQLIWKVVTISGLKQHIISLPNQLQTQVSNGSQYFSVGQKQLLCLARALLRKNKFLILDQATSNVDMKTDALIHRVLEQHFRDTSIITIAHRLNTVAQYDRILVMQKGKVAQEGSPYQLILRKGLFYEMVSHTGKNSDIITQKAKQSYKKRPALA